MEVGVNTKRSFHDDFQGEQAEKTNHVYAFTCNENREKNNIVKTTKSTTTNNNDDNNNNEHNNNGNNSAQHAVTLDPL